MKKRKRRGHDHGHSIGKKALRKLARRYKIKNSDRKTPSSLRRALQRQQPGRARDSQQAAVDAYREQRLRYLFSPSRFVHAGSHAELILEKDEDLALPASYGTDELIALPIDPSQFYVYWDFAPDTLADVMVVSQELPFHLRIYDVTELVFDGTHAHTSWDIVCHPLAREWYVDSLVNGRNICVELGYANPGGFQPLLRSNTISIPPASVSPVIHDVLGQFVQERPLPLVPVLAPAEPVHSFGELFFQPYEPPPAPQPVPVMRREILSPQPLPVRPAQPWLPRQSVRPIKSFHPPELLPPSPQVEPDMREAFVPAAGPPPPPQLVRERFELPAELIEGWWKWELAPGEEQIVRWIAASPQLGPFFFHEKVLTPHDQAVIVSMGLWPWQWEEYVPLGASDWALRRFLGASFSSWFRPGASERMAWRMPGASEQILRYRPPGASEALWQRQPPGASERMWWAMPPGASERMLNWSGRGAGL